MCGMSIGRNVRKKTSGKCFEKRSSQEEVEMKDWIEEKNRQFNNWCYRTFIPRKIRRRIALADWFEKITERPKEFRESFDKYGGWEEAFKKMWGESECSTLDYYSILFCFHYWKVSNEMYNAPNPWLDTIKKDYNFTGEEFVPKVPMG